MSTILEIIQRTLPNGTRPKVPWNILPPSWQTRERPAELWKEVPCYPTDCFAVVAQLMEQSGAYHHIRMRRPHEEAEAQAVTTLRGRLDEMFATMNVDDTERARVFKLLEDQADLRDKVGKLFPPEEDDALSWCLRLTDKEQREWVDLGRAWSLMLPFVESELDRNLILWCTAEWLISTAQTGHDPLWFYKHRLDAEAMATLRGRLQALNAEAAEVHKYHKIERSRIEELLYTHFSGAKSVMEVIGEYHGELLRMNSRPVDKRVPPVSKHRDALQQAWNTLYEHGHETVFVLRSPDGKRPMPVWWQAALKLLIASDEASIRMGTLAGEYFDAFRLGAARAAVAVYIEKDNITSKIAEPENESDDRRLGVILDHAAEIETGSNPKRFSIDIERDIENVFGALEPFRKKAREKIRATKEAEIRKTRGPDAVCTQEELRLSAAEEDRADRLAREARRRPYKKPGGDKFAWAADGDVGEHPAWYDELRSVSFTFSGLSDNDYVCVFPKSRIPNCGNTIRNTTNHLALLPPRGIARAALRRGEEKAFSRNKELNILLIPYPYLIAASSFRPAGDAHFSTKGPSWRWFDLNQDWLKPLTADHLTSAIDILCRTAEREVKGGIDAIVFPELALNYEMYAKLALHISRRHPTVELFIAGTSERPQRTRIAKRIEEERNSNIERKNFLWKWKSNLIRLSFLGGIEREYLTKGNFVATTTFLRYGNVDVSTYITTFQQKHHRWKLERNQINRYGLWSTLDPNFDWWENIETANRNIEFTTFRGGSTLVALVCEDLARLEPCQQLIRAIGPNLVVALLLDGPQKIDRWSARYATVLADDPGSSVLSLTSMGLIPRTTDTAGSRCIGLWKDNVTGLTREIHLPHGSHAAVLTLDGVRQTERTVDGRDDADLAISWSFKGCIPIHDSALRQALPPEFLGRSS